MNSNWLVHQSCLKHFELMGCQGEFGYRGPGISFCKDTIGNTTQFVEWNEIPKLMSDTAQGFAERWTNSKTFEEKMALLAYLYVSFIVIHPFKDGNGRTARALVNELLFSMGHQITDFSTVKRIELNVTSELELVVRTQLVGWAMIASLQPLSRSAKKNHA